MSQKVLESAVRTQGDCEVRALTPIRKSGVEKLSLGTHLIPERLEQGAQERLAATTGKRRQMSFERECYLCKFGSLLRSAFQRGPINVGDRDT
jgi:hypothetical protein